MAQEPLEMPDLKERIDKASKRIRTFIKEMDRQGYWKAADFFTKYGRNILLFAYKKLQGIESMAQQPHGKKNGRNI